MDEIESKVDLTGIESKIYSQHGEDGIIEFLVSGIAQPNQLAVEIGAGSGRENNTTALFEKGWGGLVVERKLSRTMAYLERSRNLKFSDRVLMVNMECTVKSSQELVENLPVTTKCDFFSIDIDSMDWWIVKGMLEKGFNPSLVCVEYNAIFGESLPITIPYENKYHPRAHRLVDFGCSLTAWKGLLGEFGYRFVTVDSSGTNAFFVKSNKRFKGEILGGVDWVEFAECRDLDERLGSPRKRRKMIDGLTYWHTEKGEPVRVRCSGDELVEE